MKRILKYVGRYKLRLTIGLTIKFIGTIMDLAIPYILSYIIDYVIPLKDLNKIIISGALMIACSLLCFVFNVVANQSASFIAKNVTGDLRHDLFAKIEGLSCAQIDEITMPSLISRMTTDTYNVHQMVGMSQRLGVRAPILLIGGIVVTFTMDPILTLILLGILPIVFILAFVVSKLSLPMFTKVQEALDHLVRIIRENVTGIRVIKALSKATSEKERYNRVNKEVMDYEIKSGNIMAALNPTMNLFLNFGLVFVIVLGATRIRNGETEIGKVISFTTYFSMILNAMLSITRLFTIYSRSIASAIRIDYIFNIKDDLVKEECEDISDYEIEFRNVSFQYHKIHNEEELDNKYNVKDINFKLKKGQSIGIIGPTGSGKTTIISLLMRLYDVNDGAIYVAGKNVKSYDKSELRTKFGTALQNDTIFTDTIKNNIDFYRGLSEEDIIKASKCSQAYEFIDKLPKRFDEDLSAKGTNISGGQKQRIFIARALANNPDILIFDDSSSALDYKTDAKLRNDIKEMYPNITSVIITQRISSIINCDYIMMIDNGIVTGYGKHSELLENNEEYQEIYKSQMGDNQNKDLPLSKKGGNE